MDSCLVNTVVLPSVTVVSSTSSLPLSDLLNVLAEVNSPSKASANSASELVVMTYNAMPKSLGLMHIAHEHPNREVNGTAAGI